MNFKHVSLVVVFFLSLVSPGFSAGDAPILVIDNGGHTGGIFGTQFSSDGSRLITSSSDGTVRVWDLSTRKPVQTFRTQLDQNGHGSNFSVLSTDNKWLAIGSNPADWRILIVDFNTGQVARTLHFDQDRLDDLDFSSDGTRLMGCGSKFIKIFDINNANTVKKIHYSMKYPFFTEMSPDGKVLLVFGGSKGGGNINELWNIDSGKLIRKIEAGSTAAFTPDNKYFIAGKYFGSGPETILFDAKTGRFIRSLTAFAAYGNKMEMIADIAIFPDGKKYVALGSDSNNKTSNLYVVDFKTGKILSTIKLEYIPEGRNVSVSSDNHTIALASYSRTYVELFEVQTQFNSRKQHWLVTAAPSMRCRFC